MERKAILGDAIFSHMSLSSFTLSISAFSAGKAENKTNMAAFVNREMLNNEQEGKGGTQTTVLFQSSHARLVSVVDRRG